MPNQPKTTARTIRVDDDLWRQAAMVAEDRGESVSEAVRRLLQGYVQRHNRRT